MMLDMSEFYRDTGYMRGNAFKSDHNHIMHKESACNDPLTMVFINMQPLDNVYTPHEAFCNGTLFPNLNKPFLGGKRV